MRRASPPAWLTGAVVTEPVRIACCQYAPDVEVPTGNADRAQQAIADAADHGAEIIVLPELASSGYVFESAAEARAAATPADGALLAAWAAQAARADTRPVVVGGFCELARDGRVHNSCALVDGSGIRAVYRKVHLWDRETRWFCPGDSPPPVVATEHRRVGLAVCYDLEFPELTRALALAGAEVIAIPTNWPLDPSRPDGRPVPALLAAGIAYWNKVFVAVCDRCGEERGQTFEGSSVIAGPDGSLPAGGASSEAASLLVAECDLARARVKRTGQCNDAFADRRPDVYGTLTADAG
jgi:predicted amidohydrolase